MTLNKSESDQLYKISHMCIYQLVEPYLEAIGVLGGVYGWMCLVRLVSVPRRHSHLEKIGGKRWAMHKSIC